MSLYTVKKGKHYFKGNRMQPVFLQYGLTLLAIILGITLGSWWYVLAALVIFICFNSSVTSEFVSETVKVYFQSNCIYKLTENYDQINKLYGFSEGFHHWNSARIGWRCVDGKKIELLAYAYIDGVRITKSMAKVSPESWILCNIQNQSSKYVFKVVTINQNVTISLDKGKKSFLYSFFKLFMYRLYPYFGGKISAPNNMNLYLVR